MHLRSKFWANLWNTTEGYPNILIVLLIVVIGWFLAGLIKRIATNLIQRTEIDEKIGTQKITLSRFVGKLLYFLAMIFVFVLALEKMGMHNVLDPIKNMLNGFLSFIPNIIGGGLVAYIGYMLATVVSELVGLSGDTIRKLTPKLGFPEQMDLVGILKKLVFILIFIPLLISALDILKMDAISQPATAILNQFFDAIPKVLLAIAILMLFIVGGKYLVKLLKDLLQNLNLDRYSETLYLAPVVGKANLPNLIGNIVYFFIVIFGVLTALEKLRFARLTEILDKVTYISGQVLFGLVIILIGNWVSLLARNAFIKNAENSFVSSVIRTAILAIFLAMGLRTMGIGDEIINLAFGITLGTVAVTIALSFGLGGRPAAGKQMEKVLQKFNGK